MSYVMLPGSSRAVPKTHAERTAMEEQNEPALGGARVMEASSHYRSMDVEDEPGAEMAKGARVWKTYVRETDRWDKDMVEGRNNSLDVLLIFAALFSAISTTFIIESLGDLKSDPAESSARTLLAISQKLDAIVSGQAVSVPTRMPDSDTFSPSRSAVVVNILWLLSLSLSVAVSLIAMLAKEWCYKFMSGRFGQIYDQGRRRQQRWNGIEKWKMQELLRYLPGLMHLALLLFAVGLCIYLWDINFGVALPVTIVTLVAAWIYVSATVLSVVDQFCPYSTPVTPTATLVAIISIRTGRKIRSVAHSAVYGMYKRVEHPAWCVSALNRLMDLLKTRDDKSDTRSEKSEEATPPMDIVTGQMLAWMIVNCEDSRSVDIALQAIAGATPNLPHADLAQSRALEHCYSRLNACTQWDGTLGRYYLKDVDMLHAAMRYCRAFRVLIFGDTYECATEPSTHCLKDTRERHYVETNQCYIMAETSINLFTYADGVSADLSVIAPAATGPVYFCSWSWEGWFFGSSGNITLGHAAMLQSVSTILTKYINNDIASSSQTSRLAFLDCYPYYMISCWPKVKDNEQSPLLSCLVNLFLKSWNTTPDLACTIAVTMAATSFVIHSYPGGEQPPQSAEAQKKRAAQVLQYYQTNKPDDYMQINQLFAFGIIALLPHINTSWLESQGVAGSDLYDCIKNAILWYPSNEIHTLPSTYSWAAHCASSHERFTPPLTEVPEISGERPDFVLLCTLLLQARLFKNILFVPALVILFHAKSEELQNVCIHMLAALPVAGSKSQIYDLLHSGMLANVCDNSPMPAQHMSICTFYSKLLVATIMLSSEYELVTRQAALDSIIRGQGSRYKHLEPTNKGGGFPTEDRILQLMAEEVNDQAEMDGLNPIMQIAVDFCHAEPSKYPDPIPPPGDSNEKGRPRWVSELQAIKDDFESRHLGVEHLGSPRAGDRDHVASSIELPKGEADPPLATLQSSTEEEAETGGD